MKKNIAQTELTSKEAELNQALANFERIALLLEIGLFPGERAQDVIVAKQLINAFKLSVVQQKENNV